MSKRVCVIYTGGTIGMVQSENGYVPDRGAFLQSLEAIPDLHAPDFPSWEVAVFDPLLDSSDIAVGEWNKIGRAVAERYDSFDGFVVLHGTDTMAYSASALSFMLEGLGKPVIFTGAQIPLCQLRSDGRENIVTAMVIAAGQQVNEVCIYFNGRLLRGCRSTKRSSDQFGAFESPNYPVLAQAGISIQYQDSALRPHDCASFRLRELEEVPVGVIKVFPGIQFELFEAIMTERLRGVVLEGFGAGNIPGAAQNSLLPIIRKAYDSGTIITVCSQCVQGAVSLGAYAASKALRDIGAVNGKDMTTEAALTKLYYLFSLGLDKEEVKRQMGRDLRGELTE